MLRELNNPAVNDNAVHGADIDMIDSAMSMQNVPLPDDRALHYGAATCMIDSVMRPSAVVTLPAAQGRPPAPVPPQEIIESPLQQNSNPHDDNAVHGAIVCPSDSAARPSEVATLPAAQGQPPAPMPPQVINAPTSAASSKRRRVTPSAIKKGVRACVNKLIKSVEKRHHQFIKKIQQQQQQQLKDEHVKQQRRHVMQQWEVHHLPVPGVPDMKQVDLCLKYSRFVPPELRSIICPKPDDSKIEMIKSLRQDKRKKRLDAIKSLKGEKGVVGDDGVLEWSMDQDGMDGVEKDIDEGMESECSDS